MTTNLQLRDAFSFKRGMRLPSRIVTLVGNGLANLDSIDPGSIKFVYRKKGVVERNLITATVVSSTAMTIKVDFGTLDTDELARYEWHIEATIGGLGLAWPERDFYTFSVTETIET